MSEPVDFEQASRVAHAIALGAEGLPPRDYDCLARAYLRLLPTGAAGEPEFSVCVWCEARVEWTASADRAEAEARLREHSATCPKHPAVTALNTPAREPVAVEDDRALRFAAWLTTRPGVMTVGASEEAGPMAEAVHEWQTPHPPTPEAVTEARLADAFRQGAEWTGLAYLKNGPDGFYSAIEEQVQRRYPNALAGRGA